MEPKLELKKVNAKLARLKLVQARAASRTKRRIQQQEEERLLKEQEQKLQLEEAVAHNEAVKGK